MGKRVKPNKSLQGGTGSARPWHSLSAAQVLHELGGDRDRGLGSQDASLRLAQHGRNLLPRVRPRGPFLRFLGQFNNILIYVLLFSALGALLTGDLTDAAVIFAVTFINAVIGFVQEGKAESALNAIRDMLSLSATALRDGKRISIPAEDLVPGDIVFLQSGDKVPADLRLLESKNLRIDESALTGESQAAEKSPAPVAENAVAGDRTCMAFSGTLVVYGQAAGLVVSTGAHTELGRINALLNRLDSLKTPLQRQLTQFGNWLTVFILLMSAASFAFGIQVRGYGMQEMFMAVVGIAVAAIPEGLPAVVTITLAVGVQRMARRNAIIRSLPAVETLGSVTVICTDKTGTLTQNEMTVRSVALADAVFSVDGVGYEGKGGFKLHGQPASVSGHPILLELARAGVLCNDAELAEKHGQTELAGDPTEGALLTLGLKAGLDIARVRCDAPRIDSVPFESEHRFMATLNRDASSRNLLYLKGAPEEVLVMCDRQRGEEGDTELKREYWHGRIQTMAEEGQRVLALAVKTLPEGTSKVDEPSITGGFSLLGLCGLIDPPREEAIHAVSQCHEAGIRVKMITGDHGVTANAIAEQMAIGDGRQALLGTEIETLSDRALAGAVREVDVFARSSPEHKLRLVEALQARGQIVAMTGDGVNDAPALKRADIGVAMGRKGTEAAKEASVMVLADDNFATIANAVEEGRTIHDNLRKAMVFILPTSFGQAGAIMVGIFLGLPSLPITPLQILWVNMVTAVTLSLSLSFEPPEEAVMKRPPRGARDPLLSRFFLWRIVFVSILLVGGLLGLFLIERNLGSSLAEARTAAVNALVVGEIFYLFNSRLIHASALSGKGFSGNRYVWLTVVVFVALQLAFTYTPFMQELFGTDSIDLDAWRRIGAFGLALFLAVEIEKGLVRAWMAWRKKARAPHSSAISRTAIRLDRSALARYAGLSIVAAIVTIGLKAWAWRLTGSVGLLSDAMESLVNLVAAVVALAMLILAARPPDDEHHFGHGKAEYFSSGLEGALIIVAAIAIGASAYERLVHPTPLESLNLGLLISSSAALVNLATALVLLRAGRRHGSITLEADARHLLTDVWTTAGVLLGLGAVSITGWQQLDPFIAIAVAVNIVLSGVDLMRRSMAGLLDATLPQEENARIDEILDRYRRQNIEFHALRTRQAGADRFMTVHVLVPGDMTVKAGHDLVERIEAEIREAIGEITVFTHMEPRDDPASFNHGDHFGTRNSGRESLTPKPPTRHVGRD